MDRISNADVKSRLVAVENRLRDLGILEGDARLILQTGGEGYAYRLYSTGGSNGSGWSSAPLHLSGDGFLGKTKREAWVSLRIMDDLLWAVQRKNVQEAE